MWRMNGVISGSGRLILANGNDRNYRSYLNGNNLHTGGTIARNGVVDITIGAATNNTVYGSGDIWVLRAGNLFVRGLNNIGAGAKVRIESALSMMVQQVPDITTNSDGIIGFGLTTGSTINDRFASSTPLGNGTMRLGATPDADCYFTGSSLAALVANDSTRTYRLGGNGYSTYKLGMNTSSGTAGALKDLGGNPHNVEIGGGMRVDLSDDNPFTGTLTVQSGASCYGYLPDATGNPFGTNTGALVLQGAKSSHGEKFQVANFSTVTRTLSKGAVSFDGSVGPFSIDGYNANPTWTTTVAVASLDRVGRSTLSIDAYRKVLGDKERLTVSGGVPSNNGMVAPYLWNGVDGVFLDYGVNGFTNAPFTQLSLATSTATDVVSVAGATVPAGGAAVYALKSTAALLAGGTLTNYGGGMILTGATITHTAPMDFGANEAVMYVTAENTLSGRLTGSGGLTKSGTGTLKLRADNTGFTGGITVNEGWLDFLGGTNLGGVANVVTLNGGGLTGPMKTHTNNNAIVLGAMGGTLGLGTYAGNISGAGTLLLYTENTVVQGANNTYSGGTYVYSANAGGPSVDASSSLSTGGTVTVASSGNNLGNPRATLTLKGAGNLTAAHRLVINSYNGTVWFNSIAPVVGSIEGNGLISFGAGNANYTLRVGGNNRSTDYFGVLVEASQFWVPLPATVYVGTLIKEGTGTLTLWGESWYRGGTIVSNGTLMVNNWINPVGTVVVKPGATLDGIGTVGVVTNLGGTVKGNLHMRRLVMDAAATVPVTLSGTNVVSQYSQLHVTEGLTLGGSTLALTLGFAPSVGQTFTLFNNTSASPIIGQFAQGRVLTLAYNGVNYAFAIDYAGGDGNDIVLTVMPRGTVFSIR
jgi:autotransporter-associated beta strand protein